MEPRYLLHKSIDAVMYDTDITEKLNEFDPDFTFDQRPKPPQRYEISVSKTVQSLHLLIDETFTTTSDDNILTLQPVLVYVVRTNGSIFTITLQVMTRYNLNGVDHFFPNKTDTPSWAKVGPFSVLELQSPDELETFP